MQDKQDLTSSIGRSKKKISVSWVTVEASKKGLWRQITEMTYMSYNAYLRATGLR